MKSKKIFLIAIMLLILVFTITGCTVKNEPVAEVKEQPAKLALEETDAS